MSTNRDDALLTALDSDDIQCVRTLLQDGVDPNKRTPLVRLEESLLQVAVLRGNVECARLLLDYGANFEQDTAQTCLHMAVQSGIPRMVSMMLDAGASIDSTDGFGATPVYRAVSRADLVVTTVLLDRSADPNMETMNPTVQST